MKDICEIKEDISMETILKLDIACRAIYDKVFKIDALMDEAIKHIGLSEINLNNAEIELSKIERDIFL